MLFVVKHILAPATESHSALHIPTWDIWSLGSRWLTTWLEKGFRTEIPDSKFLEARWSIFFSKIARSTLWEARYQMMEKRAPSPSWKTPGCENLKKEDALFLRLWHGWQKHKKYGRFFLIMTSQPPASSWCGLRGKLLEKHQGCKQVEPNAFQPPWNTWLWWILMLFHLFLKHIPWVWDGRLELYDQGVFGDLRVFRWFSF